QRLPSGPRRGTTAARANGSVTMKLALVCAAFLLTFTGQATVAAPDGQADRCPPENWGDGRVQHRPVSNARLRQALREVQRAQAVRIADVWIGLSHVAPIVSYFQLERRGG